jgi:hypothetical protein
MSQNLSPFHAEVLDFIKRDVAFRVAVDGFDASADPELKAFQQTLASVGEEKGEEALPLNEIVENYQYLFSSRGPLHLEKKLLDAFPLKDVKDHGIHIYRGLPRIYRREKPADSHVKKNFVHLPTLKRLAMEKALFRLYEKYELPPNAKLSFFTWVIHDGWGDYIAAFESIEILRRRFTDLQVNWVVLFPKRLGSPPTVKGVKTHLLDYEKEAPLSSINSEALEILRTSDLVIQLPTFYPSFEALRERVDSIPFSMAPPPRWISIGEYGFVESGWFHPRTANRSMGLHFLEKGILVKDYLDANKSFAGLENFELLQWLFQTSSPGPAEIDAYRSTHHFYLAYLTSPVGGAVYLHALAKAHEIDGKGIDICSPDIGWLIRHIQTQTRLNLPIVETKGISLELYYQGKVVPLTENTNGKKIRIFCPASLSPLDFHLLVSLSGEFVAIRGNQSFSEVVSVNKGFFFDGRDHARYFMKDLLALAQNRVGIHKSTLEVLRGMNQAFLHNLPIGDGEWVEETNFQEREPWQRIALKIGIALQDPDCLAGFKKLNRIIAQEHPFNPFLCTLVQRELCHRNRPDLARLEEEAILPFLEGSVPLHDALERLRANI